MTARWDKLREAQHYARYPKHEKAERNRLAQARYRKYHAKRLAAVRAVSNILLRKTEYTDDSKRLAAALSALLTPDGIKALRRELGR